MTGVVFFAIILLMNEKNDSPFGDIDPRELGMTGWELDEALDAAERKFQDRLEGHEVTPDSEWALPPEPGQDHVGLREAARAERERREGS